MTSISGFGLASYELTFAEFVQFGLVVVYSVVKLVVVLRDHGF